MLPINIKINKKHSFENSKMQKNIYFGRIKFNSYFLCNVSSTQLNLHRCILVLLSTFVATSLQFSGICVPEKKPQNTQTRMLCSNVFLQSDKHRGEHTHREGKAQEKHVSHHRERKQQRKLDTKGKLIFQMKWETMN